MEMKIGLRLRVPSELIFRIRIKTAYCVTKDQWRIVFTLFFDWIAIGLGLCVYVSPIHYASRNLSADVNRYLLCYRTQSTHTKKKKCTKRKEKKKQLTTNNMCTDHQLIP